MRYRVGYCALEAFGDSCAAIVDGSREPLYSGRDAADGVRETFERGEDGYNGGSKCAILILKSGDRLRLSVEEFVIRFVGLRGREISGGKVREVLIRTYLVNTLQSATGKLHPREHVVVK